MTRNLIAILAALMAFAAAPAVASASPELLTSTGVQVEPETEVTAVNVGSWRFTGSSGTIECEQVRLDGKVHTNREGKILITIQTSAWWGDDPEEQKCTSTIPDGAGGTVTWKVTPEIFTTHHWCLEADAKFLEAEFKLTGSSCTAASEPLRFTLDATTHNGLPLLGSCVIERSSASGTYNKNTSPLELTLGSGMEFKLVSGGSFCPKALTLDGKARLETTSGQQLKIV
jgi:hypothetical protein